MVGSGKPLSVTTQAGGHPVATGHGLSSDDRAPVGVDPCLVLALGGLHRDPDPFVFVALLPALPDSLEGVELRGEAGIDPGRIRPGKSFLHWGNSHVVSVAWNEE